MNTSNPGRVVFVNRYFYPDESATSQLLTDLARFLAAHGEHVTVIASRQKLDDPDASLPLADRYDGITVERVRTSTFGRRYHLGRLFDFLTFYVSASWKLICLLGAGDILVVKTDPPLMSVLGATASRIKRCVLVNWWQDAYPEIAARLDVPFLRWTLVSAPIQAVRNWSARVASTNVVIGRCMRDFFAAQGISESRIAVIPNWVDDTAIIPVNADQNQLRSEWGMNRRFVIGYSGNIGRSHQFDVLLDVAAELAADERVVFLFIGQGANLESLQQAVTERGLHNVEFRPFQPRKRLGQSLTLPDVHVVCLDPRLTGLIVPSKFYGALAAGRPVVFIGPEESEISRVIREADCGLVVSGADGSSAVQFIQRLLDDPQLHQRLCKNSRAAIDGRFSQKLALAVWYELLKGLAPESGRG